MQDRFQTLIQCLKKIERSWPPDLMLFSNNGALELCFHKRGDPTFNLASFPGIKNDGGDFGMIPPYET